MRRLIIAFALVALAGSEVRADHHTGERVAVLDVRGPGRGELSRQLRVLVSDDWQLASHSAYRPALGEGGVLDAKTVTVISRRLGVAAILTAVVHRYQDGDELELGLVAGSNGARASALRLDLASSRLSRRTQGRVRTWLERGLASILAETDQPSDGGAAPTRHDGELRRPRSRLTAPAAPAPRLRVAVGAHAIQRTLGFNVRPDMVAAPKGLTAIGHGVSVQARYAPLADGVGARLEVECGLERALSVRTDEGAGEARSQASEAVTLQGWRAGGGLRLWGAPGAAHAVASMRYNKLTFAVPADSTYETPATDYTFVDPGLAVRAPLSASWSGAAEARALLATAAGQLTRRDRYGAARTAGYELHAALDVDLGGGLMLAGELSYRVIGLQFDGTGALASESDGDASTVDVGGALDQYARAAVSLGYRH